MLNTTSMFFIVQNIAHPQHRSSISSWTSPSEAACRIDGSETSRTRFECGVQPKKCYDASWFYCMPDRTTWNEVEMILCTKHRKLQEEFLRWWLLYQPLIVRHAFTQHLVQMPYPRVSWNEIYMPKTMMFPVFHKILPFCCWHLGYSYSSSTDLH